MVFANEELISIIEEEFILAFQDDSVLGFFPGKDIGSIGVEKWIHMKLDDIPDASLTAAGFNPQNAKLNARKMENWVYTASEDIVCEEKTWDQFQSRGMDVDAIYMIGSKVAKQASYYLWRGKGTAGNQPMPQYNFLSDLGASGVIDGVSSGDGTLERPSILSGATGGVWTTWANKSGDLSQLTAQLVQQGYNLATTIIFYPRVAHQVMNQRGSTTIEVSAIEYLVKDGVMGVEPLPNEYMQTAADALPTAVLFDLYAIDISQIEIGYTRQEQVRVVLPYGRVRSTAIEGECWFVPYIKPRPISIGGTADIVKGVSRITAIVPA